MSQVVSAQAIECYDCHGSKSPPDYRPLDRANRSIATGGFRGNHLSHLAADSRPANCSKCHPGSGSYQSSHRDGLISLGANINNSPSPAKALYKNSSSPFPQTAEPVLGTCSNVNCHFERETLQWGSPLFQADADCDKCHGLPPAGGASGNAGSHARHNSYFPGLCSVCHPDHAAESGAQFSHATSAGRRAIIVAPKDPQGVPGGSYSGEGINYLPSQTASFGSCSGLYCHSNGRGGNPGTVPEWGQPLPDDCTGCHGGNSSTAIPMATGSHNRHITSQSCSKCHYSTVSEGSERTITGLPHHVDGARTVLFSGSGSYNATSGSCADISCHGNGSLPAQWGGTSCLGCHSVPQGARAAVSQQFGGSSHHIQGELGDDKCYQCHWEANSDGTINVLYHGGAAQPGSPVDLVVYGAGVRPTDYISGSTVVQNSYATTITRQGVENITTHCLGCHSDQNNATQPFGDGKTPRQYAWDGTSVAARYAQNGGTTWGKYSTVNGANKRIAKSFSAHANPAANSRGWNIRSGVDGAILNTGATIGVQCYDCHNSHGSTVAGVTSRYSSATGNKQGGLLKQTTAGLGGYAIAYRPYTSGTSAEKNRRNPGATICLDCHLNETSEITPWGYSATFGASQPILGYWDAPRYKNFTTSGDVRRSPFRKAKVTMGGHLGASIQLTTNPMSGIDGLCTPCHDPHGVSPTLGNRQQYAVPLLKGTWLTSPYKEDVPPAGNTHFTNRTDLGYEGVPYHIDQNTFGGSIADSVTGITETAGTSSADSMMAGLCLGCHNKESLTDGTTHIWKSKDRVHEAVKGWKTANATVQHNYSCSKCHMPHNSSALPRLMVTNCLDNKHKGRSSFNPDSVTGDSGWKTYLSECSGAAAEFGDWGWCLSRAGSSAFGGSGQGQMPGSWRGDKPGFGDHGVGCHENQSSDQHWNEVTPWSVDQAAPPAPPVIGTPLALATTAIRWNFTNTASDSNGFRLNDSAQTLKASSINANITFFDEGGLTANTLYSRHVHAYNTAGESQPSAETGRYTLSQPPAVSADKSEATWYNTANVTFTNSAGTGFGPGGVDHYLYAWDQNPVYTFSGSEPVWNNGLLTSTATANGSWYLHLKSYNGDNIANGTQTFGPYYYETEAPTATNQTPASGSSAAVNDKLTFVIADTLSGIDWSTLSIQLSGSSGYARTYSAAQSAIVTQTGSAASYWVTVTPDLPFGNNEVITVAISVNDFAGNPLVPPAWSFTAQNTLAAAPTMLGGYSGSSSVISWQFTDNATNETGFALFDANNQAMLHVAGPNQSVIYEYGLTPNTRYTRHVRAYNGYGYSQPSVDASVYTRAVAPSVTADKAMAAWFNTPVTFSNSAGFGPGGVQSYRGGWNQDPAPSGWEVNWSSGTLTKSPAGEGSWYLHLWSCNGDSQCWDHITYGPYLYDATPPTGLANASPLNGASSLPEGTRVSAVPAADTGSASVQYLFQVALDSGFSQTVQSSGWQSSASFAPLLESARTFYWRVKARDGALNETPFTQVWSFATGMFPQSTTVWTSKGDFDSNAVTTATVTAKSRVQVSGLNPADDAAVTLSRNVTTFAAGSSHSLAVKADGTVWGWGFNSFGQLGDGTTSDRLTPTQVTGFDSAIAVSGGAWHSLALKADGTVWSWGYGGYGQLGQGESYYQSTTPIQVPGLSGVAAVYGYSHSSWALKADGTVWAWGDNDNGQLGDGTTIQRDAPVPVTGLSNITAIAGLLALKADGTVWSWGGGNATPAQVSGLTGVVGITMWGGSSFALKADGTVWSWGDNYYGQLGDGTTTARAIPGQVAVIGNIVAIAGTMALDRDGNLWSWGLNNNGQVGDGTTLQRNTPVQVATGIVRITPSGGNYSLALKADGSFWSWGSNSSGQLGDGTRGEKSTPVPVGITAVKTGTSMPTISAGGYHSLVVKTDSSVWSWGYNAYGQLGDATYVQKSLPVPAANLGSTVIAVAAGSFHSLFLKADGTVWASGINNTGQLGDGTTTARATPVQVSGLTGIVAIAAGANHSLALKSDGSVWSWGDNNYGQLGDGSVSYRKAPVAVSGLGAGSMVTALSAGRYHSLALKSDGTVWAWGDNYYGQLGDGTNIQHKTPVKLTGLAGVKAIDAGDYHSLSIKTADGTVWGWGGNSSGQLGDGTTGNRNLPVQVPGLSAILAVSAGGYHSLALKPDNTVLAWGGNSNGQLGDGTVSNRTAPVPVAGLAGAVNVAAGQFHSMALKSDGSLQVWGLNQMSQLGTGDADGPNVPTVSASMTNIKVSADGTVAGLKIQALSPAAWGTISWDGVAQANTLLKFRTRGAATEAELASSPWSDYYTVSGSAISTPASLWLEVEATFHADDATTAVPLLDSCTISYRH